MSIESGYPIYPEGKAADIYIKWPTDGSTAICDQCEDDEHNMFGYVSIEYDVYNIMTGNITV